MAGPTLPDAVRWYEGMRLTPHHIRQQEMRSEYLSGRMRLAADLLDIYHLPRWPSISTRNGIEPEKRPNLFVKRVYNQTGLDS